MIRSFIAWVLLFILLAFLCGLIAAGPLNEFAYSSVLAPLSVVEGDAARRALEQQFGTPFPPSASDFYRANRGDEAYWLRLSVANSEMSRVFLNSRFITCRFPLQDRYRPNFEFQRLSDADKSQMPWWQAANAGASAHIGAECTGSDYRLFRIFVDQSNTARWTLYMEIIRL
jgi:hypothetical protein